MVTRQQIVTEAREWLGTRWHHQARIKGVATDCLNLIVGVGENLQLLGPDFRWDDYPEYQGYGRNPDGVKIIEGCERFLDRIERKDVAAGDVLVFSFVGEPQHFGIVTQANLPYVLHAFAQMRKVVEHRIDSNWEKRIVACYSFRGIE